MKQIDRLIQTVQPALSGERAVDTVWAVARYNRIVGSRDYAAAAELLCRQLAEYGLDTAEIERFPIDGQQQYTGRVFAPAWEPHSARLEVIAPERYVIADFAVTPMCLPSGCPATPAGGVRATVVDVGRGDQPAHYADVDVAGKAVLATGLTTDVYNLAVETYGAACVMTTNMYDWSNLPAVKRTMLDLPDATHLARLYYSAEKRRDAPVFSITYRHAERLRDLARQGPVTIQATVEAENKPGELLVVSGTLQGTDLAAEEVWITAHLCHPKPGACDNASGVALGVEIMRTLAALVRDGNLARPRRTLRLLLLPEMSGTQAYMDRYQEQIDQVVALFNLDMVGASYAQTGAYCRLVQTPWSRPSYLNHLGAYVLEQVSLGSHSHINQTPVRDWLYALNPYDKGSDHDVALNSRYAIPGLFFFYWPHRYYHTDLDTPEKLDPREFERVGTVAATLALAAATMQPALAKDLINLMEIEGERAVKLEARSNDPTDAASKQWDRLWALGEREKGALQSVLNALPLQEQLSLADAVTHRQNALDQLVQQTMGDLGAAAADDGQRWRRLEPWPLNLGKIEKEHAAAKTTLQELRAAVTDFEDKAIAALNYVDGRRTVAQIARLVAGELGVFPLAQLTTYFALLGDVGVIERKWE
ncbi:MAG: DUF4910 domain-containing protein [Caldilineaceae bacterium]